MEFNATFLVSIISFLTFVYCMNKLLYSPLEKIVKERRRFIEDNYNCADKNHDKAEELEIEREDKLIDAKENARKIYVKSVEDYKLHQAEVLKSAKENSSKALEEACLELENVTNNAKQVLKSKICELASDITEKVLGYRSEVQNFDDEVVDRILYKEEC